MASLLFGLLILCLAVGGGGIPLSPLNLVVQFICILSIGFIRPEAVRFANEAPRGLVVLVGLTIALPALQLIPLPPGLWHGLPGRGAVVQSLSLIGATQTWMPLSLDPNRTAVALMAVLSCLPIVILTLTADRRIARMIPVTLVGFGLFSAVLGAAQLARGNQGVVLQPRGVMRHQLYATFANHNASGLFFVICLVALVAIKPDWLAERLRSGRRVRRGDLADTLSRNVPAIKLVLGALFALCTVLSQSRSSLLVLAVVLVWLGVRFRHAATGLVRRSLPGGRSRVWIVAGLLGLAAVGAVTVSGSRGVRDSFARFERMDDPRFAIWTDVHTTIDRYMPIGAGLGAFDEVFPLDESLETISTLTVGRAHSDYLEATVESGVAGPLLILSWAIWIGLRAWQARAGRNARQTMAAFAVMVCFALQSLVDYPLRNMAMLAIAASMIGLLGRPSAVADAADDGPVEDEA